MYVIIAIKLKDLVFRMFMSNVIDFVQCCIRF